MAAADVTMMCTDSHCCTSQNFPKHVQLPNNPSKANIWYGRRGNDSEAPHLHLAPVPDRQRPPLADVQAGCWAVGKVRMQRLERAHIPHLDLAVHACE